MFSSWIRWDRGPGLPNQAILMDLPNRKAYLFGIEIWPEETYYIAGILMLAALGLFFVTSLFGRIWCGYTCPHTVYVDLFTKIERYFQGDRNDRIKLDSLPWTQEKIKIKLFTHLSWIALSFSFAFGWVCYFYNAPILLKDIVYLQVTSGGLSWLIGLTISTYFFAGFVREKVCTYFCPYGRFQSAMLDNDSSVVTYHNWRGEPRGKFDKTHNNKSGDCIDCYKCVVVCPMGIDIRDGLQMKCIGCGLCIDACNSVMEKINLPLNLISYDSVNSTNAKMHGLPFIRTVFKAKTVLFSIVFTIVSSFMLYALSVKPLIKFTVFRDSASLFIKTPDGGIRNTFKIKVINRSHELKRFRVFTSGVSYLTLKTQDDNEFHQGFEVELNPEQEKDYEVFVKVPEEFSKFDQKEFDFVVEDIQNGTQIKKTAVFMAE